ncbi:MAG: DUF1579 domain-containing protein [Phycisphaeraceae bacterium]|nr:DUF1579 domain-containing protein [Phycisphaeraceae bacterium]
MNWKHTAVAVGVAVVAYAAGRAGSIGDSALAQPPDKKAAQPAGDHPGMDMDPAIMKAMTPGEHHKVLEQMLGVWEGNVTMWMAPGAEPMKTHGTAKREMILDGRYLMEHVSAPPMGPDEQPFKGLGIVGYNGLENKYESVWMENVVTWMATATGTYDAAKKTLTFEGDRLDPMTGKRVRSRDSIDMSNPKRHTMVSYATGPDGKEYKCFEGVFEKQ